MTDLQPRMTKIEIATTELRSIWENTGALVPEDIVETARPDDHPLHQFFEWDDSAAAQKWRLWQAAGLIARVKVHVMAESGDEVNDYKIRAWMPASKVGLGSGHYLPEADVRNRPEQRERLLRQMRREIASVRRRYQHLAEFWSTVQELAAEGETEAG